VTKAGILTTSRGLESKLFGRVFGKLAKTDILVGYHRNYTFIPFQLLARAGSHAPNMRHMDLMSSDISLAQS
jgi:hypothetical protein